MALISIAKRPFMWFYLIIGGFQVLDETPRDPASLLASWLVVLIIFLLIEVRMLSFSESQDDKINKREYPVFFQETGQFELVKSEDLLPGMIVKVEDNYIVPADIVLLTSTNSRGVAYIDSRNLEGDSGHKEKYPVPETCMMNE